MGPGHERKIETVIANLMFLQTSLVMQLKGEPTPESKKRITQILRSTLSSLKVMSKHYQVTELSILADNIYDNTTPQPVSRWRKTLFFLLGFIFSVGVSVALDHEVDLDTGDGENPEAERKLREAIRQMGSAIQILQNLRTNIG